MKNAINKIPVGIVLYNPELQRLKENIDAIYQQCDSIILVDNNSKNYTEICDLVENYEKIAIIRNSENLGIAKALNQICDWAKDYEYILTLDQDSVCPSNIFDEYKKNIDTKKIGILCPTIKDRNVNEKVNITNQDYISIDKCITSASLVSIKAWKEVNGFDEDMFIDGVDFDFCYRLKQKKYSIYRITSVELLHEIGKITERKFLFWKVRVKNHSAFRKYYIARNTIFFARKKNDFFLKSYLQVLKQYLCVLIYEDNKKEKISSIIKGYNDGRKQKINTKWQ